MVNGASELNMSYMFRLRTCSVQILNAQPQEDSGGRDRARPSGGRKRQRSASWL